MEALFGPSSEQLREFVRPATFGAPARGLIPKDAWLSAFDDPSSSRDSTAELYFRAGEATRFTPCVGQCKMVLGGGECLGG
jgi:hypothetical protein